MQWKLSLNFIKVLPICLQSTQHFFDEYRAAEELSSGSLLKGFKGLILELYSFLMGTPKF